MTHLPHICIDATCIVPNGKGGSLYAKSLIQSLQALNPPAQFTVLARDEVADSLQVFQEGWSVKRIKVKSAYLWFLLSLPRLIKRLAPDLVHILGEGSVAWMPTPYIIAVHELPHLYRQKVGEFKRSLYASIGQSVSELFLPRTCRRATSILALSHSTADDLIQEYRVAAEKVSVAYPAANNIFFQVSNQERSRWCENLPQPYLLTFATGDRREVPSQVVEAFGQICRQVSHCLVIAGKCPDWQKSELIAIAKQQGCAERLYFTGYVPDAELPFLYRDADIFIELSRYEGFGLQVCEAMATGTDVITTDVSSLPEVVGSEGHLVALNDPSQLGTTIAKILTQPKSHATEKSLCNQAATFSWDTCSQLTWLAMKSIVYE